jgi:hypothetical protein
MKTLVSAAAVAAIAGSAFGLGETLDRSNYPIYTIDTPGITITRTPLSGADRSLGSGTAATSVYGWDDNTPVSGGPGTIGGSGFLASPPGTGVLGFEDYGSTVSASGPPNGTPTSQHDTMNSMAYEFVGGVSATGGILFFDFYFNDFTVGNYFGVAFPSAGAAIWTITFDPTGFIVPTEGYHAVSANTNPNIGPITSGQWYLSDSGANPIHGTNDLAWDSGSFDYGTPSAPNIQSVGYLFALGIPAPGTVALMGFAGLAGASRRRR